MEEVVAKKKMAAKQAPSLRFPGFGESWKHVTLENLTSKTISYGIVQAGDHVEDGMPYIKSIDLNTALELGQLQRTSFEIAHKYRRSEVVPGDIVFSLRGNIGVSQIVPKSIEVANLTQGTARISVSEDYSNLFIQKALQTQKIIKHVFAVMKGSTFQEISLGDLRQVKVTLPTLPEQQKIAGFLSAVDARIQQLTRKKALLEQYKKGVMQQLFTQAIRFTKADGSAFAEWEEKRLGEVGATFNGLTGKAGPDFGEGAPFITYKQIFDSSRIKLASCGAVRVESGEKQSKAKYGDVFFTTSSETRLEVGFTSVLLEEVEDLYLNSFCFGYRINSHKKFSPDFARYLFRSELFRKDMVKLGQGSTRYNISKNEVKKLLIKLPSLEEQQKIAGFLGALDARVQAVGAQLAGMQQWKKGLLQGMFV